MPSSIIKLCCRCHQSARTSVSYCRDCLNAYKSERRRARGIKPRQYHGSCDMPEYHAWLNMKQRCFNRKRKEYPHYGGRGITICERWMDFRNFLADMGPRPSPKHSLDRYPDNDGPYSPENCRWATWKEQNLNHRHNRRYTHEGLTLTMVEWAERLGVPSSTLHSRLRRGWPIARALSSPRQYRRR